MGNLWARLSADLREEREIYINRTDKEDPEVMKWIYLSFEIEWK